MSAKPRDLLAWFLEGYRAETPTDIHSSTVFVGRPGDGLAAFDPQTGAVTSKAADLAGGSHLGAPGYDATFRRYIEDSPFATEVPEYEGHRVRDTAYKFPIRAALARLAGRGSDRDTYPFMARFLYRVVCRDGDWLGAARSMGIIEPVAIIYLDASLRRLFAKYEVEPPARPIPDSEAAA